MSSHRRPGDSGAIHHSVLRLDDSILEVSDTRGERAVRPAMLHLSLPPTHGERSCGLRDPWGVEWWLAEFTGD